MTRQGNQIRRVGRLPNPCRPQSTIYNHDITPILRRLQADYCFSSRNALITWLTSDEVRPYWREFKRDYLTVYCPLQRPSIQAVRAANGTTHNVSQAYLRRQAALDEIDSGGVDPTCGCSECEAQRCRIDRVLWDAMDDLQKGMDFEKVREWLDPEKGLKVLDRESADKREWDVNCHLAWFVAGVYNKMWRERGPGSLFKLAREPVEWDDGKTPSVLVGDLLSVLTALVEIEKRQPGWGPGTDLEEEEEYM